MCLFNYAVFNPILNLNREQIISVIRKLKLYTHACVPQISNGYISTQEFIKIIKIIRLKICDKIICYVQNLYNFP